MNLPYKVLVADDEASIIKLSCIILDNMGLTVITASDGADALQKIDIEKPDIIISDIFMPQKTGFDICRALHLNPKWNNTPILLLTALSGSFETLPGYFEGHQQYLCKPFQVNEFQNMVLKLIQSLPGKTPKKNLEAISSHDHISSGISALDQALGNGFSRGSNWLIRGPVGSGKSEFCQKFLSQGLLNEEVSLLMSLDDNEAQLKKSISHLLKGSIDTFEAQNSFRLLSGIIDSQNLFMKPDLNQLMDRISDLSFDIGQTISEQRGGRRAFDSITSLFAYFSQEEIFTLIQYLCKNGCHSGNATTLFTLDTQTNSNTEHPFDHIFDGILDMKKENHDFYVKITSAKWGISESDWILYSK